MYNQVLAFWFAEIDPKMWWTADEAFDRVVADRFSALLASAALGGLFEWRGR